ncbi:hypothetical protein GW915_06290 [bacterium]|nr:hypothetical protein [bacterium]
MKNLYLAIFSLYLGLSFGVTSAQAEDSHKQVPVEAPLYVNENSLSESEALKALESDFITEMIKVAWCGGFSDHLLNKAKPLLGVSWKTSSYSNAKSSLERKIWLALEGSRFAKTESNWDHYLAFKQGFLKASEAIMNRDQSGLKAVLGDLQKYTEAAKEKNKFECKGEPKVANVEIKVEPDQKPVLSPKVEVSAPEEKKVEHKIGDYQPQTQPLADEFETTPTKNLTEEEKLAMAPHEPFSLFRNYEIDGSSSEKEKVAVLEKALDTALVVLKEYNEDKRSDAYNKLAKAMGNLTVLGRNNAIYPYQIEERARMKVAEYCDQSDSFNEAAQPWCRKKLGDSLAELAKHYWVDLNQRLPSHSKEKAVALLESEYRKPLNDENGDPVESIHSRNLSFLESAKTLSGFGGFDPKVNSSQDLSLDSHGVDVESLGSDWEEFYNPDRNSGKECNGSSLAKRGSFKQGYTDTLVIYFSGHAQSSDPGWSGSTGGNLPASQWRDWASYVGGGESGKQGSYAIDQQIDRQYHSRYILGSSHLCLTMKDLQDLMRASGAKRLVFASHSGGYDGLQKTLNNIRGSEYIEKVDRVAMLDNFYRPSVKNTLSSVFGAERLPHLISGFFTSHNSSRFQASYGKKLAPKVKDDSLGHKREVRENLANYL